jgi:hypothetical protein
MTVLQNTSASFGIINQGQGFYRIFQKALGNGDIFGIDQSAKAIIVGPNSDFAEYTLYYLDPLKGSAVNLATISSDQPFVGDINARLDRLYGNTDIKGQLVITPKDLYIPTAFFSPGGGGIATTFEPFIDLIIYSVSPSQVPDKRPRRVIRSAVQLGSGTNRIRFPTYGRRLWSFAIVNAQLNPALFSVFEVTVIGYSFALPSGNASSDTPSYGSTLTPTVSMVPPYTIGRNVGMTYNAEDASALAQDGTAGYWDYIEALVEVDVAVAPDPTAPLGGVQVKFSAHD